MATVSSDVVDPAPAALDSEADDGPGPGRARGLGPARVAVLVAAVAFLAGAVGWALGGRDTDPLNATDVGFLQDMSLHHEQAIQMSLLLLDKDDVDPELGLYAVEIIMSQRFDQGIFNATLDRFGHPSAPGDTVMGWMGHGIPADQMPGMASTEQMGQLRDAGGAEAESLWIALMSEHHVGGLHMAEQAAETGQDATVLALARGTMQIQADEVLELARYRARHELPFPEGFTDPVEHPLVQDRLTEMTGG
jgi:uncharacterized protein (DUF305 family)